MDKVLSARVDESVVRQIGLLAHQLRVSKKRILEGAVRLYAHTMRSKSELDVLEHTFGAWKRKEKAGATAAAARQAFRRVMLRHQA